MQDDSVYFRRFYVLRELHLASGSVGRVSQKGKQIFRCIQYWAAVTEKQRYQQNRMMDVNTPAVICRMCHIQSKINYDMAVNLQSHGCRKFLLLTIYWFLDFLEGLRKLGSFVSVKFEPRIRL